MILLNFGHPLTAAHLEQIEALTGQKLEQVLAVPTQFDHGQPFAQQVRALVDGIPLSPDAWQTTPLLINPPTLHLIAVTLIAEPRRMLPPSCACARSRIAFAAIRGGRGHQPARRAQAARARRWSGQGSGNG